MEITFFVFSSLIFALFKLMLGKSYFLSSYDLDFCSDFGLALVPSLWFD